MSSFSTAGQLCPEIRPHHKSSLNLSPEDLAHALQELEDEGLARCSVREQAITSGWGIRTTPEGRQAIRRSFRVPQAPVAQIGAIFHGPVNATNLVNAISSQIEQTISSTDPEAIRQAITETLGDLTRSVADVLDPNQRELYTQAAAELQKELEKSDPDPTIVQKLMRILSFGDTLDGALELGTKALAVSAKVAPYIYILYEGIRQLTGLIG